MNQVYSHALPAGVRIGSYEIQDVLGVGGFGITYRAHDHVLNQTVAVKEYLPNGIACRQADGRTVQARSEEDKESYAYGLESFLEEARTLAKFRDASIVRVLSYIKAHGTAYLVMDFEQGESLARRLKLTGRLPEGEIRAMLVPLLHGLRCIHAQHFLHRDIKPANILLRENGTPVLLDFGAARQALSQQTMLLTAMVTPGYAPFEQYFNDDQQGPWTDLYGIGATVYHCMTGNPPVPATKRVAALYDKRPDPIVPVLASLQNDYSTDLLDLVGWLLKPEAKERPQNTGVVLERLALVQGRLQQKESTQTLAAAPEANSATSPAALSESLPALAPEVLENARLRLAEEIGPIAGVLVRKASRQTSDPVELTKLLSRFIPGEERRTRFVGRMGAGMQGMANAGETTPPADVPAAALAATIDVALVEQAKTQLAAYIGPIATMLVRNAARNAATREQFLRRLAAELPDEAQQTEFLRRMEP
jgi:serine/threonine protein kinase